MKKRKRIYHFDPNRLHFKKANSGLKNKILKGLTYLSILLVVAIVLNIVFSAFFYTPKEKALLHENKQLKQVYNNLENQFEQANKVLKDIERRDSNIYRAIFETKPNFGSLTRSNNNDQFKDLTQMNHQQVIKQTDQKIKTINEKIAEQNQLISNSIKQLKQKPELAEALPSIQPIRNPNLKRTAAGWGWKIHPIYKIKKFHYGIDFTASRGEPVFATANGKVKDIINTPHAREGKQIILEHGQGYKTVYAHLSKFNVNEGETVERGDVIGLVGSTGLSTAPHLHYEVYKDGQRVNPVFYFFHDLTPKQYKQIKTIASSTGQSFD